MPILSSSVVLYPEKAPPAEGRPHHYTMLPRQPNSAYIVTLDMFLVALVIVQKFAHLFPLLAILEHMLLTFCQVLPCFQLSIVAIAAAQSAQHAHTISAG